MIFDDARDLVRWIPGRWKTVGVSARTWRRWMDGKARIPLSVVLLARLLVDGDLGALDPRWHGWRLVRGKLWDEANTGHSPATIHAWHWTRQELAALRRREHQAIRKNLYNRLENRNDENRHCPHPTFELERVQLDRPDGERRVPRSRRHAVGGEVQHPTQNNQRCDR